MFTMCDARARPVLQAFALGHLRGRVGSTKVPLTAAQAMRRLAAQATAELAEKSAWFFQARPGGYGQGDAFRGVRVPVIRRVARDFRDLDLAELAKLLRSKFHEDRMLAMVLIDQLATRKSGVDKGQLLEFYVKNFDGVNNWDLVDTSAPSVIGGLIPGAGQKFVQAWADSPDVWKRRASIVAFLGPIRRGRLDGALEHAGLFMEDTHDLIKKAAGWVVREVGERDVKALRAFLGRRAGRMPRTMLRYAIEKLPPTERRTWLNAASPKAR
jgi:3-methyladenine DNA glycosylase AlkD